jgi:hypothetical protein
MIFKPGDRVVCVEVTGSLHFRIKLDEIYTVDDIVDDPWVHIVGIEGGFLPSRFRPEAIQHRLDDQEYNDILAAQDIMDTLTNG